VSDAFLVFDGSRDDFLEVSGEVVLGNRFSPKAKKITVRIGRYAKTFRLGRDGRSTGKGKSYFELSGEMRGGRFKDSTVAYTLYLKRVSLFRMLPSMGFYTTDEAEDGEQALLSLNVKIDRIPRETTFVLGFDSYEEEWMLIDGEDSLAPQLRPEAAS
jgi:hypothetical protein